jgi:hypothetical protein
VNRPIAACLVGALLGACTTPASADELRFRTHNLAMNCYSSMAMKVTYGGRQYGGCTERMSREKRTDDDKRWPSAILDLRAFEGPLKVQWQSRDAALHEQTLDLAQIFKDRVVLHAEDPQRIDGLMPMIPDAPTIVVEVNDRTLRLYMDVRIALRPQDPAAKSRDVRRNRTLAYEKIF